MTSLNSNRASDGIPDLSYKPGLARNVGSRILTFIAGIFSVVAVLPLILVLGYVIVRGGSNISLVLFTELPPPPGLDGGGIANAIVGTLVVTVIAALIAIPVGVGGGIFLAEYSRSGWFAQFIRFGTNVLSGVPSIIAGVFIYGTIVTSRVLFGNAYSALAGGMALSILMLPTVIKTTDEGLKLVSDDLRRGALGVGASRFVTIAHHAANGIHSDCHWSGSGHCQGCWETAPLIFTALFSPFWSICCRQMESWHQSHLCRSDLQLRNYAYEFHNELAWSASFVLVLMILADLLSRWLARFTAK